ncbi:MAG: hypothetical protein IPM84_00570 [Anaerolineae bacterium]|nr:hypothetical protein [Anaerolineae bacterium]
MRRARPTWRAYLLNWAGGVSRFYFYAWDNHTATNIELTAADNTTLTAPAWPTAS